MYEFLGGVSAAALSAIVRGAVPEVITRELSQEQLRDVLFALYGLDALEEASVRRALLESLPEGDLRELGSIAGLREFPRRTFDLALELSVAPWTAGASWVRQLAQRVGIPDEYLPKRVAREPAVESIEPFAPPPPLFDYQRELADKVSTALLSGGRERFLLQLPTGAGKTRVAMEGLRRYLSERDDTERGTVVWLAHTEELCEQATESFRRVWQAAGSHEVRLGRLWGPFRPDPGEILGEFLVAGYQKCLGWCTRGDGGFDRFARSIRVVVVDEAHKVLAPSIAGLVQKLEQGGKATVFGLTATPGRGSQDLAGNLQLARFFGRNLLSAEGLGADPIAELQKRGILARVVRREVASGASLVADESDVAKEVEDVPAKILAKLARDEERNEIICDLVQEAVVKDGLSTLVFCCTVEHAKALAVKAAIRRLRSGFLDCRMARSARQRVVKGFRDGEVHALFNFGVLSTGFDAPNVGCVVIARPTTSIVLYSQMIGRGLRGELVGGAGSFRLVDVRDNIENFGGLGEVYGHFSEYWRSGGDSSTNA